MFFFPSFLIFTTQTSSYSILNPYGWQFWKIWIGDKKSFSLTKSVFHATFRWQICHRKCCFCMKKAAMISSSLLLKMSVPYRNRTYNRVLGGPRYIHLTKGTNAVFSGFFSPPGYGCHIYESNTKWWISIVTYFDIQVNPYWNRTRTYHFSTSVGVNHGWTLGGYCYIHLTTRTI